MASVTFPSTIVRVFNPVYVEITGATSGTTATVTVGSNSVDVVLYSGGAKVMISRLLQLCFTNPATTRSMSVNVSVTGGATGSATLVAIWGSTELGNGYGQFTDGDGTRVVHYFKAYPFTLDTLTSSGFTTRTITAPTVISEGSVTTIVKQRNETEGAYFRWVDRYGFIQYYLFRKGNYEIKNTLASYTKQELTALSTLTYDYNTRPMYIDEENTLKVSATRMDADTIKYVSSIVSSPIVDLYLGNSLWMPVHVVAGTYSYSEHHLKVLQDLEISISLPKRKSQIL